MLDEINPWVSMWVNPRLAIRAIVSTDPKYGVLRLAWAYALHTYLGFASYWSFGLSFSFLTILGAGVVLAPLIGWVWVYFTGWVLFFTGGWLGGKAPMIHLRAAASWSQIPSLISLLMWLMFAIVRPETTFIHGADTPSFFFTSFIVFVLAVWSFILFIQAVREIQHFSRVRALINIIFAQLTSSLLSFFVLFVFKCLYINL